MLYISVLRLEKPSLDLDTATLALELSSIFNVAALPGGGAVVGNYNYQVLRLNSQGRVTQVIYSCVVCTSITGLLILGELLYILHVNGTVLETGVSDGRSLNVYTIPDVSFVMNTGSLYSDPDKIPDKQTLLLCDSKGEVFTFKPSTGQKQVRITGLRDPTSVSYYFNNHTVYYIVCEGGTSRNHEHVHIYNNRWHRIRTIRRAGSDDKEGGPIGYQSAILSDEDTIILSDRWSHRVSEFSFNGTFLRDLLVISDGINSPQYMSYYFPHLWLIHGNFPYYRLYRYNLYG